MVVGRSPIARSGGSDVVAAAQRLLPFAVASLGVAINAAAGAVWSECRCTGVPAGDEAAIIGTGLLFVLVGLIAWLRPGTRRVGALMSGAGLAWHSLALQLLPNPIAFTFSELAPNVSNLLLGHLAVAFPSGRLRTRLDRWVVGLMYGLYLPARLGFLVFQDPGPAVPSSYNLLLVRPDRTLHQAGQLVFATYSIVITLLICAVVVRHWFTATRFGRRALAPVLWAALPASTSIIALTALDVTRSSIPLLMGLGAVALGFLVGVLRTELDHAAVSRLVIELGDAPARADLRDALARTLHDPSLTLAYWLPERAAYADSTGLPVRLPGPGSGRAATVLQSGGTPIAAVFHDAGLEYDPGLLEATAAAARLAVENERFQAELRNQLEEVRTSRARILAAADDERRRFERSLQHRVQGRLDGLSAALTLARTSLRPGDDPRLDAALGQVGHDAGAARAALRELAWGVHPAVLADGGLGAALESLALGQPLPVRVSVPPAGERLRPAIEATVYFVIAEALTNVVKHAAASSASVVVRRAGGRVLAEVRDDGVGGAVPGQGSGLQGMADRVAAVDGCLEVVSPGGGGTVVRFWVPA